MSNTRKLTQGALIAALYVVLTLLSQAFGLASGVIQLRLSEALTILPIFTWAAVPGLAVGCIIANMVTGCAIWDIVFGTLATLIGALGTYWIGRTGATRTVPPAPEQGATRTVPMALLATIPPVITNTLIIPFVLQYAYGAEGSYGYFCLTIGIGEILSCMVLGLALYKGLRGKVEW